MPTNFTGSDVWRDTIVGPENAEDANADSVNDLGVLLADRTIFLFARRITHAEYAASTGLSEDSTSATFAESALEVVITLDQRSTIVAVVSAAVSADANGAKVRIALRSVGSATTYGVSEEVRFNEETLRSFTQFMIFQDIEAGDYQVNVDFAEVSGGGNMTLMGPASLGVLVFGIGEEAT